MAKSIQSIVELSGNLSKEKKKKKKKNAGTGGFGSTQKKEKV